MPLTLLTCTELLLAPPSHDGKWLVRIRPCEGEEYILGVVFHGKATHHLLVKDPGSGVFAVNKRQYSPDLVTLEKVCGGRGCVACGRVELSCVGVGESVAVVLLEWDSL